MQFLYHISGEF